jgi:hypothetical protein
MSHNGSFECSPAAIRAENSSTVSGVVCSGVKAVMGGDWESGPAKGTDLFAGINDAGLSERCRDMFIGMSCRGVSTELLGVRDDLMMLTWNPLLWRSM